MAKILSFPRKKQDEDSFDMAMKAKRTPETQAKIEEALRRETFQIPMNRSEV